MAENQADQHSLSQGRTFVWHELYTPDVKGAVEFYTGVLGFGTQEMEMGEMGTYTMLTKDGQGVAGVMDTAVLEMPDIPPHWAVYTAVDDVDGRAAAAEAAGGKIVFPAMDVPTVGRMCLIQDPQGAHVWLFKPADM